MAQEAGTSLMDLITSDPPPPGNPAFPPLNKGGASERPTKNVPPRKSNVQMTPELLGSIKTGAAGKAGTGLFFVCYSYTTQIREVEIRVCLQMYLMKPG
jgi:hypothetical protein